MRNAEDSLVRARRAFHDTVCKESLKKAEDGFTGYTGSFFLGRRPLTAAQAAELEAMKAFLDNTDVCRPKSQGGRYSPTAAYAGLRPVRTLHVSPGEASWLKGPTSAAALRELSFSRIAGPAVPVRRRTPRSPTVPYIYSDEGRRAILSPRRAVPSPGPKHRSPRIDQEAPVPRRTLRIDDEAAQPVVPSTSVRPRHASVPWTVAYEKITGRALPRSARPTLDLDAHRTPSVSKSVRPSPLEPSPPSSTAPKASVPPRGAASRSIVSRAIRSPLPGAFRGRPDFGPAVGEFVVPGGIEGGRRGPRAAKRSAKRSAKRCSFNRTPL